LARDGFGVLAATIGFGDNPPDYLLLVGWNYADEILRCEKLLREQGVKFILPIPVPQVMSSTDRRLWTAV
jgi:hypothetical protein